MIDTNETLLDRVKATDAHDAWKLFYEQYWAVIMAYARKLGLGEHQAEEVLQETMVTLMRILPEFHYDRSKGKFRNYLLTIVHRKSLAAMRRTKREQATVVPWDEAAKHDSGDPFNNHGAHEAEILARWRESVFEVVLDELAQDARLGEETMAVFRAYVVQGRPAPEVAAEFGLKENAVYQIKNRLSRRVQAKVASRMNASTSATA